MYFKKSKETLYFFSKILTNYGKDPIKPVKMMSKLFFMISSSDAFKNQKHCCSK